MARQTDGGVPRILWSQGGRLALPYPQGHRQPGGWLHRGGLLSGLRGASHSRRCTWRVCRTRRCQRCKAAPAFEHKNIFGTANRQVLLATTCRAGHDEHRFRNQPSFGRRHTYSLIQGEFQCRHITEPAHPGLFARRTRACLYALVHADPGVAPRTGFRSRLPRRRPVWSRRYRRQIVSSANRKTESWIPGCGPPRVPRCAIAPARNSDAVAAPCGHTFGDESWICSSWVRW